MIRKLIIALVVAIVIGAHWIPRERTQDPALAQMAPGCVADLTTGSLDCFRVFDDGTWIRTRGY